jgi:hypothetical protein
VAEHMLACQPVEEELQTLLKQRTALLEKRRATPRRVKLADLPENERPQFIAPCRTQLLNTIRIIAYRAETCLVQIVRESMARVDDARALAKDLFTQDADLRVDAAAGTLTVALHFFTHPQATRAIESLLTVLNQSETYYPGTTLLVKYAMVSAPAPVGQEL